MRKDVLIIGAGVAGQGIARFLEQEGLAYYFVDDDPDCDLADFRESSSVPWSEITYTVVSAGVGLKSLWLRAVEQQGISIIGEAQYALIGGLIVGFLASFYFEVILTMSVALTIAMLAAVIFTLFQPPSPYKLSYLNISVQELLSDQFIHKEMFTEPVVHLKCGNTLEKSDIMDWLVRTPKCPACDQAATSTEYRVNWLIVGLLNGLHEGKSFNDFVKIHRFEVRLLSDGHSYALRQAVLEERARVATDRDKEAFIEANKADMYPDPKFKEKLRADVDLGPIWTILQQERSDPSGRPWEELFAQSTENIVFRNICEYVQKTPGIL